MIFQCGIESVKTAADVYAPVSGEVSDTNKGIAKDPAIVNTEAEKGGWLFKVKVSDAKDLGTIYFKLIIFYNR